MSSIRLLSGGPGQRLVGQSAGGNGSWIGDKIGASLDLGGGVVERRQNAASLASSLASLDLPLRDDDDDDEEDDDDDDDDDDDSPYLRDVEAPDCDYGVDAVGAVSPPLTPPPTEFSLTHMTASMVDAVVDDFQKTGDSAFLLNSVRTVFR